MNKRIQHLADLYVQYNKEHGEAELEGKIRRLKAIQAPQGYIKKMEKKLEELRLKNKST